MANLQNNIKKTLLDIDPWLGKIFKLKIPAYTKDPNLISGTQICSAEEWGLARRKGASIYGTNGTQYDSNDKYLQYIFSVQGMKIHAAISLTNVFDFSKFNYILEIGCGDMPHAFVIKNKFPHLCYSATDYDPYIIERCSKLTVLNGIEKGVFDVVNHELDVFKKFDLLISCGLDAVIEDECLLKLLSFVRKRSVPYLMRPSIIGVVGYALNMKSSRTTRKLLKEHKIRMIGWRRSFRYFKELASRERMKVQIIGKPSGYFYLLFTP